MVKSLAKMAFCYINQKWKVPVETIKISTYRKYTVFYRTFSCKTDQVACTIKSPRCCKSVGIFIVPYGCISELLFH